MTKKNWQQIIQEDGASLAIIIFFAALPWLGMLLVIPPLILENQEALKAADFWQRIQIIALILPAVTIGLFPNTAIFPVAGYFWKDWSWIGYFMIMLFCATLIGYFLSGNKWGARVLAAFKKFYPEIWMLEEDIRKKQNEWVFFMRLSPMFPFAVTNLFMGVLKINLLRYLIVGTLGMLPRAVLTFWAGREVRNIVDYLNKDEAHDASGKIVMVFLAVGALGVLRLFLILYKKMKKEEADKKAAEAAAESGQSGT